MKPHVKMNILDYCAAYPREYTYIGIGTKNRTNDLEKFIPDFDQILPCFLDGVKKSIRAIHFDPAFRPDHDHGFLERYFQGKGFIQQEQYMWTSSRIEVIVIPQNLSDDSFLKEMIQQTIDSSSQLVVQQFTGHELLPLFKQLYLEFNPEQQSYIRQNVLFDITYGADCNCGTPMTQYAPVVDSDGHFYNFSLFTHEEQLAFIGRHPSLDKLIAKKILASLSKILNEDSVNYRKAVRGEPLLFKSDTTNPEEIMRTLLRRVSEILAIMDKLGILTPEKKQLFATHSQNYKELDMYKWYSDMTKLYK
jgi:hypothetical protein